MQQLNTGYAYKVIVFRNLYVGVTYLNDLMEKHEFSKLDANEAACSVSSSTW